MSKNKKIRPFIRSIIMWPLYLAVILIIMNIYVYFLDTNAGRVVTLFLTVYLAGVVVFILIKREQINEQLVRFGASYGQVQKNLIKEMAVPYALLDGDGRLLSANNEFMAMCPDKIKLKVGIGQIFPEITKNVLPADREKSVVHLTMNDKKYCAELKNIYIDDSDWNEDKKSIVEDRDNVLISIFFYDETEILRLQKYLTDRQLVVALLYIDNYEEALESIDEVRRSLLSALIDRKINKYFQEYQVLLKKIEKDKYLIVFQNQYLEELKGARFTILDEVRDVNIGNEMAVTVSMGIGTGTDSYTDSYEAAHAAIDLALGRGGDQVVIKDKNEFLYFGGKSASVGKSTRVKARVKAQSFREIIEDNEKVLIMGHSMPDADAFGAAVGVYRMVKYLDKKAYIILNNVTDSISMIVDRFRGDQAPAEYADMIVTSEQAMALYDENTVLVIVDVNRPGYTECPELLEIAKTKVLFDHHRQTSDSINDALLSYIEPYISSACEMVTEMLQYVGDGVKLKSIEAEAMYSGIMIDTNNFLTKTGVRTFEAAAFLKRCGADVTRIRKAFRTDMEEYIAKAKAISTAEVFMEGFILAECAADSVGSPTVLGAQVANELMDINNVKASFVFTDYNNQIYISARSIDEVNVQVVMEKLGGGGHMSVAGAQLTGCTIEEAKQKVKEVLSEMVENKEI
ncbi:MAG: DHH family phosphoesterase [Lachnospiraceae bacterium]|nr:DHH family phosphoesterase [Lachnospiraceae bacterium]MBQ6024001.1 DHH family phosphoesterase [Lachnospiraceae bacterium]MBR3580426.1 DHH family phosphoesterase [Lachnospiraceae bacterium]MBR4541773.1 DHH family phosphoesterase [Lachnospiraceae bacterium]